MGSMSAEMDAKAAKQIEDIRALLTAAGYEVLVSDPMDGGRWTNFIIGLVRVKTKNDILTGLAVSEGDTR